LIRVIGQPVLDENVVDAGSAMALGAPHDPEDQSGGAKIAADSEYREGGRVKVTTHREIALRKVVDDAASRLSYRPDPARLRCPAA
jgi:hypothetical protein